MSKKCPIRCACNIITFGKFFKCNKVVLPVLRLTGVIASEGLFKKGMSLDSIEKDIEKAFETTDAKAVILQVNSPGGSPVQSEFIFNRIRELSKEKNIPVYAFAEDVAASGGYWLLCAADEIYASVSSIIGSIGVISGGFGFADAIKKIGVERRIYTQGENKSILDPFKAEKKEDVEILLNLQKDVHDAFKDMVRSRRAGKIKVEDEKRLFSGEFWNGKKALELGLIDGISDMRSKMKEKFGDNIKYVKVNGPKGWLKRKLGSDFSADRIIDSLIEKTIWSKFGL